MSERIAVGKLQDNVGREVEVTFRGKIVRDTRVYVDTPGLTLEARHLWASERITLIPFALPPEPQGLGAIVTVTTFTESTPITFVRVPQAGGSRPRPWLYGESDTRYTWDAITAWEGVQITVLSEGVAS